MISQPIQYTADTPVSGCAALRPAGGLTAWLRMSCTCTAGLFDGLAVQRPVLGGFLRAAESVNLLFGSGESLRGGLPLFTVPEPGGTAPNGDSGPVRMPRPQTAAITGEFPQTNCAAHGDPAPHTFTAAVASADGIGAIACCRAAIETTGVVLSQASPALPDNRQPQPQSGSPAASCFAPGISAGLQSGSAGSANPAATDRTAVVHAATGGSLCAAPVLAAGPVTLFGETLSAVTAATAGSAPVWASAQAACNFGVMLNPALSAEPSAGDEITMLSGAESEPGATLQGRGATTAAAPSVAARKATSGTNGGGFQMPSLLPAIARADRTADDPVGSSVAEIGQAAAASEGGRAGGTTVMIGNLIENFTINSATLHEDAGRVKELVTEALISAVNDVHYGF